MSGQKNMPWNATVISPSVNQKNDMWLFIRRLLFTLDPETAHHLTLQLIKLGAYQPLNFILRSRFAVPGKPVQAFGLHFPNPVGLAAGYDKDGLAWRGLAALGFGHIEIGTVTPRPQAGNPKPRLFRLVEDRALINRMGFPGLGAEVVAHRMAGVPGYKEGGRLIVGVNLGKNKDTPLEDAAGDYISLLRRFTPLADYIAVNVSSPNTAGLRRLQGREMLETLLGALAKERQQLALGRGGRAPLLVKLAPDLTEAELDDALDVIVRTGMDGVIAANTTLEREAGLRSEQRTEVGGLSGQPLRVRSAAVLQSVVKKLGGRLPVISVGGIMGPEDAKSRLDAGATLVQVYTGLVYAGPGLVKKILQTL
jgi:dihydroorotate dehydrogenase